MSLAFVAVGALSLVAVSRGLLLIAVQGLLAAVASLVVAHGLVSTGLLVVAHALCCSPQHMGSSQTRD